MLTELFLLTLTLSLVVLFRWGFRTLPGERWQIIGCLLGDKQKDGAWKGLNLTYYGFFNATAYLFAGLLAVTQAWRALSEFFRANCRGTGKITAYQIMSLLSIAYTFLILAIFPSTAAVTPDLAAGMLTLWDPAVLLFFEILWTVAFIHTGRSRVTDATIHLHVVKEKI
jgi:hypothetical protein